MTPSIDLKALKERHTPLLWSNPAVCGIDVREDQNGNPVFTVDLREDISPSQAGLPQQIEGHQVIYRFNPIQQQ
jgi:hypothetical protein